MTTYEKVQILCNYLHGIPTEEVVVIVYVTKRGTELRSIDKVIMTTEDSRPWYMSTDAYLEYIQKQYLDLLRSEYKARNPKLYEAIK